MRLCLSTSSEALFTPHIATKPYPLYPSRWLNRQTGRYALQYATETADHIGCSLGFFLVTKHSRDHGYPRTLSYTTWGTVIQENTVEMLRTLPYTY